MREIDFQNEAEHQRFVINRMERLDYTLLLTPQNELERRLKNRGTFTYYRDLESASAKDIADYLVHTPSELKEGVIY